MIHQTVFMFVNVFRFTQEKHVQCFSIESSIIFIGNAEQTFYKKVPKTEKHLDPKRLKKNLPKQLKEIKKDKRIMLIGTSNAPFEADIKSFMKVYERLIMMPRPNYGDRRLIWMEYVNKKLTHPECKFVSTLLLKKNISL